MCWRLWWYNPQNAKRINLIPGSDGEGDCVQVIGTCIGASRRTGAQVDRGTMSRRASPRPSGNFSAGPPDAAIRFDDLCSLLESLGFDKRVKGGHHLFRKAGVEERINLQREQQREAVPGETSTGGYLEI